MWWAGAFDGHLPLKLAAHTTKHTVVGAFMRAALAQRWESKQQSNDGNHSRLHLEVHLKSKGRPEVPQWARSTKHLVLGSWQYQIVLFQRTLRAAWVTQVVPTCAVFSSPVSM